MSTARNRLGKHAKKVTQDLQEMNSAVKDAAQEGFEKLRETASDCCEQGRDKVLDAKRTVGQFIRELPIKSVLAGVGVGILLGTFWTIRRR
jgi:ElaB/YqjD/DUF883 family membrane-anchored ribosome-binding protein